MRLTGTCEPLFILSLSLCLDWYIPLFMMDTLYSPFPFTRRMLSSVIFLLICGAHAHSFNSTTLTIFQNTLLEANEGCSEFCISKATISLTCLIRMQSYTTLLLSCALVQEHEMM